MFAPFENEHSCPTSYLIVLSVSRFRRLSVSSFFPRFRQTHVARQKFLGALGAIPVEKKRKNVAVSILSPCMCRCHYHI